MTTITQQKDELAREVENYRHQLENQTTIIKNLQG